MTGKRGLDIGLFLLGVLLLALIAEDLRVYHRETHCEVSVELIEPGGSRRELETPPEFSGRQRGLFSTVRRIGDYVGSEAGQRWIPEEGRVEWTLHYKGGRPWTAKKRKVLTPAAEGGLDE